MVFTLKGTTLCISFQSPAPRYSGHCRFSVLRGKALFGKVQALTNIINLLCFFVINCYFFLLNYSIIGSILIVLGLYIVLWGKGKELKSNVEQKHKNDPLEEVEPLEIVTTKQINGKTADDKSVDDGNDIKCGAS